MRRAAKPLIAAAAAVFLSSASAQDRPAEERGPNDPPAHNLPAPGLVGGTTKEEREAALALGPELERGQSPREILAQRRKLDAAFFQLQPQRPGTVDAYVLSIALDSDPVFAREAREASAVLSRRYNATGRTLTIAGPDGKSDEHPRGSITALTLALTHLADVMDTDEDVLVLYSTSHGLPQGLYYHYGDTGYGVLSHERFKNVLEELGLKRRVLVLSACYSGVFVPVLASDDTAIVTASAANRTSFGCAPDNDWTFFGDAMINRALRKAQPLSAASNEANLSIADWESRRKLFSSLPQRSIGSSAQKWLAALEAQIPAEPTQPTGRLTDAQ
ncbi:MAG: C13 family peptidase [Marinomonas sp.]